jgi:hypothetical protein
MDHSLGRLNLSTINLANSLGDMVRFWRTHLIYSLLQTFYEIIGGFLDTRRIALFGVLGLSADWHF